jgi:hypothetical protein
VENRLIRKDKKCMGDRKKKKSSDCVNRVIPLKRNNDKICWQMEKMEVNKNLSSRAKDN